MARADGFDRLRVLGLAIFDVLRLVQHHVSNSSPRYCSASRRISA